MNNFIDDKKLLVDEETFKSMVPSTRNITDTQTIYYVISMSQKQTIKSILGKPLYDDIVDKYTDYIDNGISLSECYEHLISNYLQPILSFSSYKRLINHLSFKLKEGGLRYSLDQTTELADLSDRSMVMTEINNDINVFISDMKEYIKENKGCFPLYYEISNKTNTTFTIGKL